MFDLNIFHGLDMTRKRQAAKNVKLKVWNWNQFYEEDKHTKNCRADFNKKLAPFSFPFLTLCLFIQGS